MLQSSSGALQQRDGRGLGGMQTSTHAPVISPSAPAGHRTGGLSQRCCAAAAGGRSCIAPRRPDLLRCASSSSGAAEPSADLEPLIGASSTFAKESGTNGAVSDHPAGVAVSPGAGPSTDAGAGAGAASSRPSGTQRGNKADPDREAAEAETLAAVARVLQQSRAAKTAAMAAGASTSSTPAGGSSGPALGTTPSTTAFPPSGSGSGSSTGGTSTSAAATGATSSRTSSAVGNPGGAAALTGGAHIRMPSWLQTSQRTPEQEQAAYEARSKAWVKNQYMRAWITRDGNARYTVNSRANFAGHANMAVSYFRQILECRRRQAASAGDSSSGGGGGSGISISGISPVKLIKGLRAGSRPEPQEVAAQGPPADAQAALRRVLCKPKSWKLPKARLQELPAGLAPEEVEARAWTCLTLLVDRAAVFSLLESSPAVLLRSDFNTTLQHLLELGEALGGPLGDATARNAAGGGGGGGAGGGGGGGGMPVGKVLDLLALGLSTQLPTECVRERTHALVATLKGLGAKEPKQLAAAIIDTHPSVLNHPPEHLSRSLHELHRHFLDWPTGRKMREARYTPSQDAGVWLARCLSDGGAGMLERLDYAAHLRNLAASSPSFTAWSSVTDSPGAIVYDLGSARSLAVALLAQQGLDPTADPHLVPDEVWNTEHAQQWKEGRKGVLGRLRKEEARRLAACGLAPLPQ